MVVDKIYVKNFARNNKKALVAKRENIRTNERKD